MKTKMNADKIYFVCGILSILLCACATATVFWYGIRSLAH